MAATYPPGPAPITTIRFDIFFPYLFSFVSKLPAANCRGYTRLEFSKMSRHHGLHVMAEKKGSWIESL
jgi:hypothetical protein